MSFLNDTETDAYIRAMFGEHAKHVALNLVVQDASPRGVAVVGTIAGDALRFGSRLTHQLILGDAVIRPRLVIASNAFIGHGLSALVTGALNSPEEWIDSGEILVGEAQLLWNARRGR